MKEYTIIFDFDGTLADSFPLMVAVFNKMASKYHYAEVSDEAVAILRGRSAREVIAGLQIPKMKLPFIYREGRKLFQKEIDSIKPFPGITEMLTMLHKEYALGIVTSNATPTVKSFIEKYHLEVFDFIYSEKNIFGKGKVLRNVLKTYALPSQKVVYVGDEVRDIDAARSSGIATISVTWGFNNEEILKKQQPAALIHHPKELPSTVSKVFALSNGKG